MRAVLARRTYTGGGTPTQPAGVDAHATVMPDAHPPNHLVAGLHSRGVLPHMKREGGTYFVTFRQAGTLPREVLLRFKQEREVIIRQAEAAGHLTCCRGLLHSSRFTQGGYGGTFRADIRGL